MDEDFNTWLIEVNTNPCLEESSQLLKDIIPLMLEDMLKLTVDVVFPKNGKRRRFTGSSKSPAKPNGRKVSAIGASGINCSGTNN